MMKVQIVLPQSIWRILRPQITEEQTSNRSDVVDGCLLEISFNQFSTAFTLSSPVPVLRKLRPFLLIISPTIIQPIQCPPFPILPTICETWSRIWIGSWSVIRIIVLTTTMGFIRIRKKAFQNLLLRNFKLSHYLHEAKSTIGIL